MIDLKNVAIQCECTDLKYVQGHYRDDAMQVEAMRAQYVVYGHDCTKCYNKNH